MDPVRYVSGLLLVAGLLAAGYWLLRRHGAGMIRSQQGLRVLSVLPIGTRDKLIVVQFHSTELLLGVSAQGIRRLASSRAKLADPKDGTVP